MWYYTKDGAAVGPLSPEQLKSHPDIQPDTFVWREGLPNWLPFGEVEELKAVTTPVLSYQNTVSTFKPVEVHVSEPVRSGATEVCGSCSKPFPMNLMTIVPDKWIWRSGYWLYR